MSDRHDIPVDYDFLDRPLPRYQGDARAMINGKEVDLNEVEDTFGKQTNILDPVHSELAPEVWEHPESPAPHLQAKHRNWIISSVLDLLDRHGYDGMDRWLKLVVTGSLTTYQYSERSDCDTSLFVDTKVFPDWSRAEMIGIMINGMDGTKLPGTPYPMQCYVVSSDLKPEDLYKPGVRSGYELRTQKWIVPPDKSRVHDVEKEMDDAYTIALLSADKMELLLDYEPEEAVTFWDQIHKRRMGDMQAGQGDYSTSNIVYKMLDNRGLFPRISDAAGVWIH